MKKTHPFFIIGTLGMIVTSALHLFLALVLKVSSAHTSFLVIFSVFVAFLMTGFGLTLKKEQTERAA